MVRDSEEALAIANKQTRNTPGACQLNVRTWFGAPSAGDVDGDGDADAYDGWLKEPKSARHPGDRNPPPGKPLAFAGGSHGYGHRAISGHDGKVRSTDMDGDRYAPGVTGTTTIAAIEKHMNQRYLGWSETIDGLPIPDEAKPTPKPEAKPAPTPAPKPAPKRPAVIVSAINSFRKVRDDAKAKKNQKRADRAQAMVDKIRKDWPGQ